MSDKTSTGREKPEINDALATNIQEESMQAEQSREGSFQFRSNQTPDQVRLIKWPLLVGTVILLVVLLAIGYFYGSGAIDETSSITLAVTVTLLVTGATAGLWWLNRGR